MFHKYQPSPIILGALFHYHIAFHVVFLVDNAKITLQFGMSIDIIKITTISSNWVAMVCYE